MTESEKEAPANPPSTQEAEEEPELPETVHYWPAVRSEPYPPGPTPFEQSQAVQDEVLKELGFEENEKLRILRTRLVNLLRTVDEPPPPDNEYDDIEYPEDLIYLMKRYQGTAEALIGEPHVTSSLHFIRAQIGLGLVYSRIFYEGGWITESRKRVADSNLYAENESAQAPELFGKIMEATQKPPSFETNE